MDIIIKRELGSDRLIDRFGNPIADIKHSRCITRIKTNDGNVISIDRAKRLSPALSGSVSGNAHIRLGEASLSLAPQKGAGATVDTNIGQFEIIRKGSGFAVLSHGMNVGSIDPVHRSASFDPVSPLALSLTTVIVLMLYDEDDIDVV